MNRQPLVGYRHICPVCGKEIDSNACLCDSCWEKASKKGYLSKPTRVGIIEVPTKPATRRQDSDAARIFLTAAKEVLSFVLWAGLIWSCVDRDAASALGFLAMRSILWAMLGSQLRGD